MTSRRSVSDAERARRLFARLERKLDRDPALARRTADALQRVVAPPRSNRRARAAVDPGALYRTSPDVLRAALDRLDVEQLKDVVAQYAMDPGKLAMKWRTRDRLIELIVTKTETRVKKGSAFRG